ncbi:MAG: hypothetical protein NC114_06805 [Ruminococcus flavefaciens]|nr:hypothetical protein [Ruminococcus flavefaciens]
MEDLTMSYVPDTGVPTPAIADIKSSCPRPLKLIHPRIMIDDITGYVANKIAVKLGHMPNETIPIALVKLIGEQFFGTIVYMSEHEIMGVDRPSAHSVACMISPVVLYNDYGTITYDIVNEGNGTVVPIGVMPDFTEFSSHHTDFIHGILTMLAKTRFERVDGTKDFARYMDIEHIVIDCNNCEMIDEDGYDIYDADGCVWRGRGTGDMT